MTTAERSARLCLRAYPRRWRRAYGEDLVGTLLDLAGPGARTVRVRDGASVVRAGWALRWREHPALWPWLRYRLFEKPLPVQHRHWMMDDLLGRFYALRSTAVVLTVLGVACLVVAAALPVLAPVLVASPEALLVAFGPLMAAVAVVQPRARQRHLWRRHVSSWVPPELWRRSDRRKAEGESRGSQALPRQG